jgi:hypothetical protein
MRLLYFFIFNAIAVTGASQDYIDTIFVNTNVKTIIFTPHEVDFIDPGSKNYAGMVQGDKVILQAITVDSGPSTMRIVYKNKLYHWGVIAYKSNITIQESVVNLEEDLDSLTVNEIEQRENRVGGKVIDQQIVERRLGIIEGDKRHYFRSVAIKKDKLMLAVTNIMEDQNYYYLKIWFANGSKNDYKVDMVDFVFRDRAQERGYKTEYEKKHVKAVSDNKVKEIGAKSEQYLTFCLTRYILSQKGDLLVSIRELNGSREMNLVIPQEIISKSKKF